MPIAEEIQQVTEPVSSTTLRDSQTLQRLESFYREMVDKGVVRRPGYAIPLPDTVGHDRYAPPREQSMSLINLRLGR